MLSLEQYQSLIPLVGPVMSSLLSHTVTFLLLTPKVARPEQSTSAFLTLVLDGRAVVTTLGVLQLPVLAVAAAATVATTNACTKSIKGKIDG